MKRVELKKSWVRRSRERAVLNPEEQTLLDELMEATKGQATATVAIEEYPDAFWKAILDEANLTPSVRTAVTLHLFGMRQEDCRLDEMYGMSAESAVEFGTALQLTSGSPNCECNINGRWYPVVVSAEFVEDRENVTRAVRLNCRIIIGDQSFHEASMVGRDTFLDSNGDSMTRTVLDVLELKGYRRLQTSAAEYNLRLVKAERAAAEHGQLVFVTNSVVAPDRYAWWKGFEVQALGTEDMPSRCIVEPALEVHEGERYHYSLSGHGSEPETQSPLPFVRLFCLETKSYVYADVDDIVEYDFDHEALNRLHLPGDMHSILNRVFQTPPEDMFGDLMKGKHGGVVVLASGSPGVGKTLTAEIYAETTERPLYVLELGELGTSAAEVEENLRVVFARVTRWNAVLQFDECEIFLARRGTDLERSAIVGIFLRLLDYYRGLLFLTTNRPDVLDDAVLSRIMLRLRYPDLDSETRMNVWETMFRMAGLELRGVSWTELGDRELNGRQIRNLTRLAKILYPEGVVDASGIQEILSFGLAATSTEVRPELPPD